MRKVSNWCLLCVTSAFESKFSEKTFIDKSCDLELCINYIREKTKKVLQMGHSVTLFLDLRLKHISL